MRKLLSIAWLDLKMGFSDKSEIVFFLILPLTFTLILAAAMGGGGSGGDNRYPVALVDEDKSALSAELSTALSESDVIRTIANTRAEADALLKEEKVPAVLTIPFGFGESLMAGRPADLRLDKALNDSRVPAVEQAIRAAADQVSNAVLAAGASVAEAEKIRPFADALARQAYFQQSLSAAQELLKNPPARVEATQAKEAIRQIMSGAEQSSAGQLITWVSIPLIGAAAVFMDERRQGTLRRLLVMPITKASILGGKIAGRLAHGLVQMTLLILFGVFIMGVNWGQSPAALARVMLAFALACVAFGVLLATFAKTPSQANWLSIMCGMLMAALGGAWWQLEITPPIYQKIVQVLPTTWAMRGFTDIIVRGQGVSSVLTEVGILLAFAVVFFGLGIRRFKYE